jgi:hypothetical protein
MIKLKFAIALLTIVLAIHSCKKKEVTPDPVVTSPTTGTFNYKVDGNTITVDSAKATLYTSVVSSLRTIDVYAYKAGSLVLEMHFLPKTGAQTVSTSLNNAWLTYADATTYYDGNSGNFSLTVCDTVNNKIEGTFDFVGTSPTATTKTVTSGNLFVTNLKKQ